MRRTAIHLAGAALVATTLLTGCSDDGPATEPPADAPVSEVRENGCDTVTATDPRRQLTVRPVVAGSLDADARPSTYGNLVLASDLGDTIEVGPPALDATDVESVCAAADTRGGGEVHLNFTEAGSDKFAELSAQAACSTGDTQRIAILADRTVVSSPNVTVACGGEIRGSTQISGDFTLEEAQDLAAVIAGRS